MAVFKVSYIMEQRGQGWSESYYISKNGNDPIVVAADAVSLGNRRIALSGSETYLTYFRITNTETRRISYLQRINPASRGSMAEPSDDPATCIILACKDATRAKSKVIFLRGVWDSLVRDGGEYVRNPAWDTLFNSWKNEIINKVWGWQGISTKVDSDIATLVQDAGGTISGTLVRNIFAPPLDGLTKTLRFIGLSTPGNLNGNNPCIIKGTNGFTTVKRIAMLPWAGNGRVELASKTIIPIDTITINGIGERKVGRIFGAARGRLPARKRA